jgi:hypothetical protein
MEHSRAEVLQCQKWKLQAELCLHRMLDHIQTGNPELRSNLFLDHKRLNQFVRAESLGVILTYPSEEQQYPAGQLPTPAPQVCERGFLVCVPVATGDRSFARLASKSCAWVYSKGLRFLSLALNMLPPIILSGPLRELPASLWAMATDAAKTVRKIAECIVTADDSF